MKEAIRSGAIDAKPYDELKTVLAGKRVDVVIDCVGIPATFTQAQDILGVGGSIVLLGLGAVHLDFNSTVTVVSLISLAILVRFDLTSQTVQGGHYPHDFLGYERRAYRGFTVGGRGQACTNRRRRPHERATRIRQAA